MHAKMTEPTPQPSGTAGTDPAPPPPGGAVERDPRVYLAAERTFLAWIRTGLGLMGIGFAVSRFSLFLREFGMRAGPDVAVGRALPHGSGTALVLLGVLVNLVATLRHVQLVRRLRSGTWEPGHIAADAVALSLLLAAAGVGMAIYLLLVR